LLEKGTKAPDKVISAYYKTESFFSRYKQLYKDGYITGQKENIAKKLRGFRGRQR